MENGDLIRVALTLALGVNAYFIKLMVSALLDVKRTVDQRLPVQQNEIKNMADEIASLKNEIMSMAAEIKDFGKLRERVAIIEALMTPKKRRVKNADSSS